jgi:hypothetical protein
MIGCMIIPPVPATASVAAANSFEKPARRMRGMVNVPMVAALATALPEIVPNSPLATAATFAGPPRVRAEARNAMSRNASPPPVFSKTAPKIRKMARRVAEIWSMIPQNPWGVTYKLRTTISQENPSCPNWPGTQWPKSA